MDEHHDELEALEALTTPEEVEAVTGLLEHLKKDTDITLFVQPGCAVCPHQVRAVATVALASERIALDIVDVTEEPELAERHDIRAVPATVVDDELVLMGVVPAPELAWRLVERQGPEAERMIFAGLVSSGHHADAAERMADGRGAEPFLHLWARGDEAFREALLEVADQSGLYAPGCMEGLVAPLCDALGGEEDPLRREDTARLLGLIGSEAARPALERLAADDDPEVAEAAERALEALAESEAGPD